MQLHNTDVSEEKYQIVDNVWQKSNENRNTVAYKYLIVQDNFKPSFFNVQKSIKLKNGI